MVAKLISPQGEEFELTDEQFHEVKEKYFASENDIHEQFKKFEEYHRRQNPDLPPHSHRQLAVMDLIEAHKEDENDELFEEFLAHRKQNHPHLPEHNQRLLATLDWIEANPDKKSKEWWDEFEQFLKENRFHIGERNLSFDNA